MTGVPSSNQRSPTAELDQARLAQWPGRDRREPKLGNHGYLILKPLRDALCTARDKHVNPGARILDIGARATPYYPLFAATASDYVGNDIEPGPNISLVSPVESLDVASETFDVVLCTQVLEHVRHPHKALLEMARVLRPGGVLLLTTHGVYPYHPDPNDYWRWTQQGFEAMFEDAEPFTLIELHPLTGAPATLAMLVVGALHDLALTAHLRPLATPLIATLNLMGQSMDKITPESVRMRLVGNFLAVARKV